MDPVRSIYEDDPDMMEIVREFAAELPDRAAALESALQAGDHDQLRTLAHQLKGAGGGYGYPQITEVCGALEQALRDGCEVAVLKERTAAACALLRAVVVSEA